MPRVEIYGEDEMRPLFVGFFDFLPRVGDTISKNAGGYFDYYDVKEIWHRESVKSRFKTCIRVTLND